MIQTWKLAPAKGSTERPNWLQIAAAFPTCEASHRPSKFAGKNLAIANHTFSFFLRCSHDSERSERCSRLFESFEKGLVLILPLRFFLSWKAAWSHPSLLPVAFHNWSRDCTVNLRDGSLKRVGPLKKEGCDHKWAPWPFSCVGNRNMSFAACWLQFCTRKMISRNRSLY